MPSANRAHPGVRPGPTMKLKRQAITARYTEIIESAYAMQANRHRIRRRPHSRTTSSTTRRLPAANLRKGDPP
jgi:hypothetical protein